MRLLRRLRAGCLLPLVLLLLLVLVVEWQLGPVQAWFARRNAADLEQRIAAERQVRLADLEDGWDLVCLATPYCIGTEIAGAPVGIDRACSRTTNDGFYALAYFKGRELVEIETLATARRMGISKPCLPLSDDPVILTDGDNLEIRPRSAP